MSTPVEILTLGAAFVSVVLILVGLVLTWDTYWNQRFNSDMSQTRATLTVLRAVGDGIRAWGTDHFGGDGYDEQAAKDRAQEDYSRAMKGGTYSQIFRVPMEPVANLIHQPGELVNRETVEAANIALRKMCQYNQLVQQQTDFNARHLAEFYDKSLDTTQREVLAEAAYAISFMIHVDAIGADQWFPRLMDAIDSNIVELENALDVPFDEWKRTRGSVPR